MGKKQAHGMQYPLLVLALCAFAGIGYVAVDGDADHAATAVAEAVADSRGALAAHDHSALRVEHSGRTVKLGAPITLNSEVPSPISVGETVTVVLKLQSSRTAGRMEVGANFPEGLATLGVASQVFYYTDAEPVHRWELSVNATRAGNLHFGVVAKEYDSSGNPLMFRAFAVPVVVGDQAANKAAFEAEQANSPYLRTHPSGRLLIELPSSLPPAQ